MKLQLLTNVFLITLLLSSCKKEDDVPALSSTGSGSITINIQHIWNDSNFVELNNTYIHPITNDTVQFTNLKYYFTNLRLKKQDGSWWAHPESYFLVNLQDSNSLQLKISEVPTGNYTAISYLLGVDSLHNVSGAQAGALSTVNGMFWSWNSGYIQMKAEGMSPNSSSGSFAYHIGGFYGEYSPLNLHEETLINTPIVVSSTSKNKLTIRCLPHQIWPDGLQLQHVSIVHSPNKHSKSIASSFFGSFKVTHVSN